MTSDLTTREVSQRLKDVGFDAKAEYKHVNVITTWKLWPVDMRLAKGTESVPAYSASTLFEYLRDNYWEPDVKFFEIQEDGIYLASFDDSESTWIEYTNLADMLAEAIIWILTQEKENK